MAWWGSFSTRWSLGEVVFLRGATEAVNLVAHGYGRQHVGPGDEIIVSQMEHHSNIVPWQVLCEEKRLRLESHPLMMPVNCYLKSMKNY